MENLILLLLCIIPVFILLWYIYIKDQFEKEPIYLLISLFIGGFIACLISIFLSILFKKYFPFLHLPYNKMNIYQIIFKVLFTIVIIEESTKWIINYIITWRSKNFNYIYDSIVYATFVSLGFASLENILYGFNLNTNTITPIIMRGLISVPSHAVFGIFMGYYLGIAKNAITYKKFKKANKYKILSILIPLILHFIYNLLLIKNNFTNYFIFFIYIILLFILAKQKINKISSITRKLITK